MAPKTIIIRMTVALLELLIECFHSYDQHLCKFIETKESVCIRKEFNSQRTGLGHQHGRRFIVLGHQYGRRDVMWKHSKSDDDGSENVGKKWIYVLSNLFASTWTRSIRQMQATFPWVEFLRILFRFKKREENSSSYVHVLHKMSN